VVDGASDLFTKRISFDGTTLTWATEEPGGVSPEATISSATGFAADYAYYRFAPGTLTTDIVDANGTSIPSPSAAFGAQTVGFTCVTSTSTLGTSAQRLRFNNGTANNLWTASIAATAGATATWSSGLASYDFNDTTSSGCSDGGDADTVAGALSINPSVSNITAMLDCATTGVSKGSLATFNQGVVNSITLATTGTSAQPSCYFDMTGVALSQAIPPDTPAGSYTLNLTITVVAN
jgi:hypothetical protein